MPSGITKASGVAIVMKELHLKREEVAAIGDGENDRHMLQAAGLSATLANATVSLQADVDHVVASVEKAGLSHFAHLVLLKNAN
jgi:hydroxymethylpyrimidine pyrophosphatase-like HAD family hydrolase